MGQLTATMHKCFYCSARAPHPSESYLHPLAGVTVKRVPIPPESAEQLRKDKKREWGYQFVSVTLKDGRRFEPAVASEGHVIEVKGHLEIPFAEEEIQSVAVTGKHWNFRREKRDWFAENERN